MFALVQNSQFIKTIDPTLNYVAPDGTTYPAPCTMLPAQRHALGLYDFVNANPGPIPGGMTLQGTTYVVDDANFIVNEVIAVVPIDQTAQPKWFSDTVAAQQNACSLACQASATAGVVSNAFGANHTYPTGILDQQNLSANVLSSLLPNNPVGWTTAQLCVDGVGNWAYLPHTAGQIQQVGADAKAMVLLNLTKNATLYAQLAALTATGNSVNDYATITAIKW